jgi:hypothetical protein
MILTPNFIEQQNDKAEMNQTETHLISNANIRITFMLEYINFYSH